MWHFRCKLCVKEIYLPKRFYGSQGLLLSTMQICDGSLKASAQKTIYTKPSITIILLFLIQEHFLQTIKCRDSVPGGKSLLSWSKMPNAAQSRVSICEYVYKNRHVSCVRRLPIPWYRLVSHGHRPARFSDGRLGQTTQYVCRNSNWTVTWFCDEWIVYWWDGLEFGIKSERCIWEINCCSLLSCNYHFFHCIDIIWRPESISKSKVYHFRPCKLYSF